MLRAGLGGGSILYVDGQVCGFLQSVEGGNAFADVLEEPSGPGGLVKKRIGRPRWEDLELRVDLSLNDKVYDWIGAFWKGAVQPKELVVTTVDAEGRTVRQREFHRALITETTVPALDVASKEPGFLTLKVAVESARALPAGTLPAPPLPAPPPVPKLWVRANFRLELPGLDCTKVSKIDSFTVKQPATGANSDTSRLGPVGDLPEQGLLWFPNLTVTLAEQGGESWQSWFNNFVLKGNSTQDQEKTGRLMVLSSDLTKPLARLDLFSVGIFRLAPAPQRAGEYPLPRQLVAGLYCQQMSFVR